MDKIGPGGLIFPNANTYTGGTNIQAGFLTAEDSQALGPVSKTNATNVSAGAALNIQLRGNGVDDSVTGTLNTLLFADPLTLAGTGLGSLSWVYQSSGADRTASRASTPGAAPSISAQSGRGFRRRARPEPVQFQWLFQ